LRLAGREPNDAARVASALYALLRELPRQTPSGDAPSGLSRSPVARSRGTLPELERELARAPGAVEWDVLGGGAATRSAISKAPSPRTRSALAAAPRDVELGRRLIALQDQLGNENDATRP
jgi:hypothetical protein